VEAAPANDLSVLVRHAWEGDDRLRPLDARGRRQADELVDALRPLAVRRIVSSPYARCVETVEPLAAKLGLEVEIDDRLAEGAGGAAADLMREKGLVACTHGDVAFELLGRGLRKGEFALI
jgi:8-oxo-dGTP diphosphatase